MQKKCDAEKKEKPWIKVSPETFDDLLDLLALICGQMITVDFDTQMYFRKKIEYLRRIYL